MTSTYPLIPKTTAHLRPGQFWSIPLSDGRFGAAACLVSTRAGATGGRTRFIGAILDWVGDAPPSSDAIAGSPVLAVGNAHVRLISFGGGAILGERPLAADGIEPPATVDTYWGDGYARHASGAALHRRRSAADVRLPPRAVPADRRDAPAVAHRSRRRPVRPPADRRRLRAARRVVPRLPGDGPPRLRLLRPLDHGSRVPALLPDAAPVRRRRALGLADVARRPAPPAARPGGARDRRDEGQARPRRPVALPRADLALPRGPDEAPRGHLAD